MRRRARVVRRVLPLPLRRRRRRELHGDDGQPDRLRRARRGGRRERADDRLPHRRAVPGDGRGALLPAEHVRRRGLARRRVGDPPEDRAHGGGREGGVCRAAVHDGRRAPRAHHDPEGAVARGRHERTPDARALFPGGRGPARPERREARPHRERRGRADTVHRLRDRPAVRRPCVPPLLDPSARRRPARLRVQLGRHPLRRLRRIGDAGGLPLQGAWRRRAQRPFARRRGQGVRRGDGRVRVHTPIDRPQGASAVRRLGVGRRQHRRLRP